MATLDPNGVLFYQDTDNYTPIQTALNLAQSNLSNLLGGKPRFERVANTTARNALVSSVGVGNISKANPLLVWRADAADGLQLEYTTNGSTWRTIADKEYYDAQAAAQDTGWVAITPNAGFTGAEGLGYRIKNGVVYLRGSILRSAGAFTSTNEVVFTLPAAARIAVYARFLLATYASPVNGGALMCDLAAGGDVGIAQSGGAVSDIARLSSISYPLG